MQLPDTPHLLSQQVLLIAKRTKMDMLETEKLGGK